MSDLPADTLTTTIAEVIDEWWATSEQPAIVHDGVTYIASLDLAAAVVSVLATHNQHAAAEVAPCGFRWAWEGSDDDHLHECRHSDEHPGRHVCRCRSWQPRVKTRDAAQNVNPARVDRLAAVSPTPPTHKDQA